MNVAVNNSMNVNSFVTMKDYMNVSDMFVKKCQNCLEFETELVKKDKVITDLSTRFSNLEKHCITLEVNSQLTQEVFQIENSCVNQNNPKIHDFFETNDLKAQLQEKDTTIKQLKEKVKDLRKNPDRVKKEYDAIETINIELEQSVAKLLSENENLSKEIVHLKQIFKDQFESIKRSRVSNKEHNDSLIAQMNLKSVKNADLQVQIQEKKFTIEALTNELKRIKRKNVVDSIAPKPKAITIATGIFKVAEIVEKVRASNSLDGELDLACKYAERIQEELVYVHDTCPCLATPKERLIAFTQKNKDSKIKPADPVISSQHREKLVVVTPKNKQKKVSFVEPLASSSNSHKQDKSSKTPNSNTLVLPCTGLKSSTKICRS
ncbi:hypothetical protein Tco_0878561 [Tanacetum coccineum]|uniref:Uncharacterized protein n=1 Tax=Tanacetum coccineum TaxID=301880 RepID=A0ABQ5BY91_9ASTR